MAVFTYPGAVQRPLPEAHKQPRIRPTQVILHTIVGSAKGAYGYFLNSSSLESHLIVNFSGEVWQLVPFDRSADANRTANRRSDGTGAISIETEDDGTPEDTQWTEAQCRSIVAFIVWACREYGIPARICRTPSDPGIGYHTLFGAPSAWTPVSKSCPGRARIAQFPFLVMDAAAQLAGKPAQTDAVPDDPGAARRWVAGDLRNQVEKLPNLPNGNMGLHPAVLRKALEFVTGHKLYTGLTDLQRIAYSEDLSKAVWSFQQYLKIEGIHYPGAFHEKERAVLRHILEEIRAGRR